VWIEAIVGECQWLAFSCRYLINGFKKTVAVISLIADIDKFGDRIVRIEFGTEFSEPPKTMQPYPTPPRLRFIMDLILQTSEWNDQYKLGQKYELTVKETGEITIRPGKT
jgi:hypothetical protein